MRKTISIIVTGKVQGVFYRQSAKEKALHSGIGGMVKNLPDRSVYIVATGTTEQLDQFINWCRSGPPKAVVSSIITEELPFCEFVHFTIER